MSLELSAQQLTAIAQEFGTPLYVYHAERIGEQYKRLLSALIRLMPVFFMHLRH
jgi:diaminopimelate decarboxylase